VRGLTSKLETTLITITDSNIPESFDNFRIVQLSDFHCKSFGNDESDLIAAIKACNPDIIVLTGDMIDEAHINFNNISTLLAGISGDIPIYSINGNHEFDRLELYDNLCLIYKQYGVIQLDGSSIQIFKGSDYINITGANTLVFGNHQSKPDPNIILPKTDVYNILLHHYSNYFDSVSSSGYDLVLSGHTHGGIIRLPFIGGLLGNDSTLFPKYDGGVFHNNNSTMVSSRGLGDASYPRFYNNPELICITLHKD
jgi:predicted MPP superfamily phosphohydrolase